MKKNYYYVILTAVVISYVLSLATVRICFNIQQSARLSIASLICGRNLSAGQSVYKRLTSADIFVTSNITESKEHSLDQGRGADKLMDGIKNTAASPASNKIDYIINFTADQEVKQVIITWGDYGQNDYYIKKWILESTTDGVVWKEVAGGGFPATPETIINKIFPARGLRLRAESEKDWIGVHELEIVARPI